ncbi:hypothetical protein MGYG_08946 [Nannizzia gypsea CBS 118893]|uniref:Uncharacterized protein n=1 Tax=Arthroderma gypseum (strain ATCC MYA-4604 / CBS 118893) TaxID=535722 RepID=E5R2N2_ARTGP|nr:hypothetical protein MGYG_08946 [Nannizzia gypsea CBS 118893]EFQ98690.1 hypothetical protein MGYG_08946 [Nannizzia gypsea CBS 118893]
MTLFKHSSPPTPPPPPASQSSDWYFIAVSQGAHTQQRQNQGSRFWGRNALSERSHSVLAPSNDLHRLLISQSHAMLTVFLVNSGYHTTTINQTPALEYDEESSRLARGMNAYTLLFQLFHAACLPSSS